MLQGGNAAGEGALPILWPKVLLGFEINVFNCEGDTLLTQCHKYRHRIGAHELGINEQPKLGTNHALPLVTPNVRALSRTEQR
jgi:hypothetical protein